MAAKNYHQRSVVLQWNLLRIDEKEKIQGVIDTLRINPVDYTYIALDSIPKIVKDFENPTIPTENNLSNNNAIVAAVTEMANSLNAEI